MRVAKQIGATASATPVLRRVADVAWQAEDVQSSKGMSLYGTYQVLNDLPQRETSGSQEKIGHKEDAVSIFGEIDHWFRFISIHPHGSIKRIIAAHMHTSLCTVRAKYNSVFWEIYPLTGQSPISSL